MKRSLLFSISVLISLLSFAQPPRHERDTLHFATAANDMMDGPIVRGTAQPVVLSPVRHPFCFDETIDIEIIIGSHIMEQAMFMNNDEGYIGFTRPGVNGRGAIDMIIPEILDFTFCVFGYKGNVYTYHNKKGNNAGEIIHEVMTGNTETYKYQLADAMTTAPLARKNEQRTYCGGQATATAYKLPDQPTLWFMYGNRYPAQLHVRKYFGGFGVGVVSADEGIYVIMELQAGTMHSIIKNIEKFRQCFDPSGFVMIEDEFRRKRRAELEAEAEKIERHADQAAGANSCRSQRMAIVEFEREQNRRGFAALDSTTHGNIYQDKTAQKGYMSMMDPLVSVEGGILQCNLSICSLHEALVRKYTPETAAKLQCNEDMLQRLVNISQRMRDLDRQYASNPALANAKKSQLYWQEIRNGTCE